MRSAVRSRSSQWRRARARTGAVIVATVVSTVVAVLLPGGTAAAAPASTFPTTPLWVYGHSYTITPGITNTPGQEWMPEFAAQFGMPDWRTFGVGSSRMIDTFSDLSRQAPRRPVPDSAWDPARHGLVVLQSEFNDMINPWRGSQRVYRLTPKAVANYGQTLQASLAVLGSSSRADFSSARSAGRWGSSPGPAYLGGSLVYTTTPGAYREMAVDVGPSGTVWVVTWEVGRTIANPHNGATAISVDGRLQVTLPARTAAWEPIWSVRGGGYLHQVGPRATKISGLTPGRHTIRVAKADRGPGAICLDQVLVASEAPPPVLVVRDPMASTTGNWVTAPSNRWPLSVNRTYLHGQIDAVARQFPNVAVTTLAGIRAEHYGWDGIHLSDAGMEHEARLLADTFQRHLLNYDVAAMYQ